MICFGFLRIFGKKIAKVKSGKNLGIGPPTSRRSPKPQRGLPRHSEAEGLKRPPLGYATL